MAIVGWTWRSVSQETKFGPSSWVLLNQRMRVLEHFLGAVLGRLQSKVTADDGETSPTVVRVAMLQLANTGATTVTELRGGEPGQLLVILARDSVSTVQHGTLIKLNGNADWVVKNGQTRLLSTPDGLTWYEVPRTMATPD